jgi:hypothetical protein
MFKVDNHFEIGQDVFVLRRTDNSVFMAKVTSIKASLSPVDKGIASVGYNIEIVNGKNIRTAFVSQSDVFATPEDAFKVQSAT